MYFKLELERCIPLSSECLKMKKIPEKLLFFGKSGMTKEIMILCVAALLDVRKYVQLDA